MLRAADYRERARASLSGNWGMAVLVCFVGALLGGIQSVIPVTANYQYGEGMSVQIFGINMSLNQLPAEMLGILAVMMSILSIYALAQFVIGGVVELGMCAYFSKRALGENADIKDEFAYFQYFGKALGLRIVTSIFIFLWTMLFIIPGFIATYRYAMAPYIMAEHPEIGWMILSACTFGIGDLFLNPYTHMATAHFYLNLSRGSSGNFNSDGMM